MDSDSPLFSTMDARFNAIEIALFIICGLIVALCLSDAVIVLKFVCCGRERLWESHERLMDQVYQVTLVLINAILAVGLLFYLQSVPDDLPKSGKWILTISLSLYLAAGTIVPIVHVVLSVRRERMHLIPVGAPIHANSATEPDPVGIGNPWN